MESSLIPDSALEGRVMTDLEKTNPLEIKISMNKKFQK